MLLLHASFLCLFASPSVSTGFLCSSTVSPQSQQQIRCVAPDIRGAPLALTGGVSLSGGGVVVMWGYLSLGQLEDAGVVSLPVDSLELH